MKNKVLKTKGKTELPDISHLSHLERAAITEAYQNEITSKFELDLERLVEIFQKVNQLVKAEQYVSLSPIAINNLMEELRWFFGDFSVFEQNIFINYIQQIKNIWEEQFR